MQNILIVVSFLALIAGAAAFLTFNQVEAPSQALQDLVEYSNYNVVYGELAPLGNGYVQSWVHTNRLGLPTSVGVSFSQTVFKGLPAPQGQLELQLPTSVDGLDFKTVLLTWEPRNASRSTLHPAAHFNVFFKTDRQQARRFVSDSDLELSFTNADIRTEAYRRLNTVSAQQSTIWGDISFPKPHERLTSSFVYGTSNGGISFLGQTISTVFLASKPNFNAVVEPSRAMLQAGYTPLRYSVRYDHFMEVVHVSLDELNF